jgi:hypothetical protein
VSMVRRRSTVRFRNGAPQELTCEARSEAHWTAPILRDGWELLPYWEESGRSPPAALLPRWCGCPTTPIPHHPGRRRRSIRDRRSACPHVTVGTTRAYWGLCWINYEALKHRIPQTVRNSISPPGSPLAVVNDLGQRTAAGSKAGPLGFGVVPDGVGSNGLVVV